jgi:hypothetical protein
MTIAKTLDFLERRYVGKTIRYDYVGYAFEITGFRASYLYYGSMALEGKKVEYDNIWKGSADVIDEIQKFYNIRIVINPISQ